MRQRIATHTKYVPALALLVVPLIVAQVNGTWVNPEFKAGRPTNREKSVTEVYRYSETKYDPPIVVQSISRSDRADDTPEHSFISRISAMMNLEYEAWLATWDVPSRLRTTELGPQMGGGKESYVNQWKGVFTNSRIQLIRRIDTGTYVLITYRLVNLSGKSVSPIEIPAILHNVDGHWLSTLELSRDRLVRSSPWVSGKDHDEGVLR